MHEFTASSNQGEYYPAVNFPESPRFFKWLTLVAAMLAMISAGLLSWESHWLHTRTWNPLDLPIQVQQGHVQSPEFEINFPESFEVRLRFDRSLPRLLQDELIHGAPGKTHTATTLEPVTVSWKVTDQYGVIQQGTNETYRMAASSDHLYLMMGRFKVERPGRFRLDADLLNDLGPLAKCNPRLQVTIGGMRGKNYSISNTVTGQLYIFLIFMFLGISICGWISYRDASSLLAT